MKKFLAITSIDEAIDKTAEKIVYIEDGCLKKKKNTEKFEIVEKPFHTSEDILKNMQWVYQDYEKILNEISLKLNEVHHKNLSVEAWRVILLMWLPYYMETMYNKYSNIKKAIADEENLYTNILSKKSFIHPYYGYGFWIWALKREDYNFQLYSQVVEFLQVEIKNEISIKNDYCSSTVKRNKNLKDLIRIFFNKAAVNAETIIINPYNFDFMFNEMLGLLIKSKFQIGFFFSEVEEIRPVEFDMGYRNNLELEVNQSDSEFVQLIKKYIFKDMPTMYLEGFCETIKFFEKYRCKKIISAEDYMYYTAALLMGINKNRQGRLYSIPLGGDGNIWQGMSEAYLDSTISDIQYTTGWKDNNWRCELEKITNPRYWRAKENLKNKEKECDILYVASATFAYRILMNNINSIFTKEYIEDSLMFLTHLSTDNKMKIRARFFAETGWKVDERVKTLAKNVKLDDYKKRFIDTVQECRLCIVDSFGTAWAEALTMDVPIIIVIPEYMEVFSTRGWELVNKLKQIGVFHNDFKAAAKYIQKNINDIESWWKNDERQKIIHQVKEEYVWCAENAKKEWIDEFVKISKE